MRILILPKCVKPERKSSQGGKVPSHFESRIVPYSTEQLFDLVMSIEDYPEFLPWCLYAQINTVAQNNLEADVVIGYKIFREQFSSRVYFNPGKSIEVEYLKGPMRHLHNKWEFKKIRKGQCQVDFYVDFSMKSKFFEAIVEQFFQRALVKMIDSFETRAFELYGVNKRN